MDLLATLNGLLNQPNTFERNLDQILSVAQDFVSHFENKDSIVGDVRYADDIRPLLAAVGDPSARIPTEVDVVIATTLKVLLRKGTNRLSLGKYGMNAVIKSLNRIQSTKNIPAAAEMCNVILNTCYDGVNVQLLIELDGVHPLLRLLRSKEVAVICSALGALQGLCYVPLGRQHVRQNAKALNHIVTFLTHEDVAVRARAVGVIHNLSVDTVSIVPILETGCVPQIIGLMRDSSPEICHAAAGTIQNLSRDPDARAAIVAEGALEYLSDLLFASDIACQITAVGTILNIVGSNLELPEERAQLRQMLTDGLVLGAVRSSLFDV